jgi:hypothetical protein
LLTFGFILGYLKSHPHKINQTGWLMDKFKKNPNKMSLKKNGLDSPKAGSRNAPEALTARCWKWLMDLASNR